MITRSMSTRLTSLLLFTKPIIEVNGWLYQTKTHFNHIVYQPFSRVLPQSFMLYGYNKTPLSISISICSLKKMLEITFGDHNLSATAEALGHNLGVRLTLLTNSSHMQASPPTKYSSQRRNRLHYFLINFFDKICKILPHTVKQYQLNSKGGWCLTPP